MEEKPSPGLYMVATPIGNLEDLSFRALRVLRSADWIAAEDTRETKKILAAHGIHTPTLSLHEHSSDAKAAELAERLARGETGAYVSDAGTPGVSDPGAALVRAAADAGVPVHPVPGASAPSALLSVAGFKGTIYTFHGFFPRERKERLAWAESARAGGGIQVFFESPHRIEDCLSFLSSEFPELPLVVGRELTKKFETLYRGPASVILNNLREGEVRGEFVVGCDLPAAPALATDPALTASRVRPLLEELAGLGAKQKLLTVVAVSHGMPKNQAYSLALEILNKS